MEKITVKAIWDDEASVWVAESANIPGLVTEADTVEELQQKLSVMIPEMLQENGRGAAHDVPVHLLAESDFTLACV